MEAACSVEVRSDFRVTVNAQVSLEGSGEWLVAGGALVFVFRMTLDHGSGHEHSLEQLSLSRAGCNETNDTHRHTEPPKPFLGRSHFTFL